MDVESLSQIGDVSDKDQTKQEGPLFNSSFFFDSNLV